MHLHLNERSINRLPYASSGTRYEVRDTRQPGLTLRISSKSKSFYWHTRVNGKATKVHLGKHGFTTVDQARMEVHKLILQSREGCLPPSLRQEKALRKPAPTLQEIFEEYLTMRKLRDTSKETYSKIMRLYLPHLATRPVTEITGDDCYKLYSSLRDSKSPAKANGVLQLLDSLVRYAGTVYEVDVCQVKAKVKAAGLLASTPARNTRIEESQLTEWFKSIEDRPYHYKVMLITAILTGFRKSELEKLTWEDFDYTKGTLLARNTKNHKDHLLPLGPYLTTLLHDFKNINNPADGKIFGSRLDRWAFIASSKGTVPFSLHALRRTFASTAAKLIGNSIIIKALMNHSHQGDVTIKNYIRLEHDDLRLALIKIEDHIIKFKKNAPKGI